MAYEVTATRKRPQTFGELEGQDFVVASISNSLASGRIAHAYLFSGPRGVGKTSAARILAKSLNCIEGPTATPCGVCSHCREITQGNSLDVIEIDGASNTSVNDVREIRDEVLFAPSSCRYKVYIIDEVHMLSNSAFNALLKTIEEPPPYIVFVFATTEVHKVPATIRSRCQQFNFRLLGAELIVERLKSVSEEMGIDAEIDALNWIAKEASGSMRDAYTLFDQIVSFAEGGISMEVIQKHLGLVGFERVDSLASLIAEGKAREAIELADEVISQGVAVEQLADDLTDYFRGVLFAKHGIERESLLGFNPDGFSAVVRTLSVGSLEHVLSQLLLFYRNIRYSLNPRFELELLMSKLSTVSSWIDPSELVARLDALTDQVAPGRVAGSAHRKTPAPPVVRESAEAPAVATRSSTPAVEDDSDEDEWSDDDPPDSAYDEPVSTPVRGPAARSRPAAPAGSSEPVSLADGQIPEAKRLAIVDTIRRTHLSLATALDRCGSWRVDDDSITIHCPSRFHAESIRKELPQVTKAIQSSTGRSFRVQVTAKADEPDEESDGEAEGRIAMIKRVFRGEIIDDGRST
jgi:DNA polymerase III subunit gamma/tau